MNVLVIDNYDSFTYNLVYILRELGAEVSVYRNDKIDLEAIDAYEKILLSPGPGIPSEAGIMQEVVRKYGPDKSILGICLGHQGIGEVYGAVLENMDDVYHGVAHTISIADANEPLFKNIPETFTVGRYHSWTVVTETVPEELTITAYDEKGRVMGISHKTYDVKGLQFHPESVLTEHGRQILENWLH